MCLGIPGQVVHMLEGYGGMLALVDVLGAQRQINLGMLEEIDVVPGEWVLIHMGFAVERIDEARAEAAMSGLEMLGRAANRGRTPRWLISPCSRPARSSDGGSWSAESCRASASGPSWRGWRTTSA